ncbi:UDP-N-acetylmuramoyl-L-alanyl-D-glutamate--2,6-diaminopimelate ligase [Iodidimonas gelatinilytica]|uniref:UDP-N-acetylmuramoyl-L-alanyl-D-glutamate--2,6-diaminopimelate ligase n=1 Tax=Iodidimonas gelatinilytica TaxID=1236966 RepID=A0A5A7N0G9_9PROT|nr:UDP-N-acetylmuramoyl-L-alanyl-D-glutamate--2,6-diaminopimelate ligase [Iodidimonas gelatinilytica]GER01772.1 UDP-N-acetylmuramoyl-L-alanyl-D-glutamate--2,6-diaminopimelate ligase [Iodidimonas gelatinilytica]
MADSMHARPLSDLLGFDGDGDMAITGLTSDSRRVQKGYLFAALPGSQVDGQGFVPDAVARGAVAVLGPKGLKLPGDVARIEAAVPRQAFAHMASWFYGPSPEVMACVTGTNGKTSVASFTRQIWEQSGLVAASIGTLGVESTVMTRPGGLTSPDPVALHEALASLQKAGVTHGVCEASSHGLVQYRLDGVRPKAVAFTNLSRDHLDYHHTLEAYFHAKARLFSDLAADDGAAVVFIDSEAGVRMADIAAGRGLRLITVGRAPYASIRLDGIKAEGSGQRLKIVYDAVTHDIILPLFGRFQAENALVAAGLAIGCGGDPKAAFKALETLKPVPGRLEKIGDTQSGAPVFVDYAHTPDGLKTVLEALRPHTANRLAVVFGCGGDRDRGKRPEMGVLAQDLADLVVVSDDNPRSEDAAAIRRDILAACPDAREIGDRAQAIAFAIQSLNAGDCLVIAGKGHEQGQIIGDRILPFSDIAVVNALLAGRGA